MTIERGFKTLVDETITWIDTTAVNVVHFHCASGKVVSIDAEEHVYNIPVICANFDWPESEKL